MTLFVDRGLPEASLPPGSSPAGCQLASIAIRHRALIRYTLRCSGVRAMYRDDAFQETLLAIFDTLPHRDVELPMEPWVVEVASRVAGGYFRRATRQPERLTGPARMSSIPAPAAPAMRADVRELVAAAIEAIDDSRRSVFVMKEIDGQSVPVIARRLGIPLNTAYSRLRIARDEFRAAYTRIMRRAA